jgi:hypothetical protein
LYDRGILVSTDFGYTWENFSKFDESTFQNKPPYARNDYCRKFIKQDDKLLIIGDYSLFVSTDNGKTWDRKNWGMDTKNYNLFKIIGDNFYLVQSKSIYTSKNIGKTWNRVDTYSSSALSYIRDYEEFNNKIFVSSPYGIAFFSEKDKEFLPTKLNKKYFNDASLNTQFTKFNDKLYATVPSSIYYSNTINLYGLYISSSDGINWTKTRPDLKQDTMDVDVSNPIAFNNSIYMMYQFRRDFYSPWQSHFYKYDIIGKTWDFIDSSGTLIKARLRTTFQDFLIAGHKDGKVYKSKDGINWELFFQYPKLPNSIVEYENNFFFNADSGGVYYSKDNGKSWENITFNLRDTVVKAIVPYKGYLYLQTEFRGLYTAKLSDLGITSVEERNTAKEDNIHIFPNPASEFITVRAIDYSSLQCINIFDIYGNRVLTVEAIHESFPQIDVSCLLPGVYFLKLNNQLPVKFIKI